MEQRPVKAIVASWSARPTSQTSETCQTCSAFPLAQARETATTTVPRHRPGELQTRRSSAGCRRHLAARGRDHACLLVVGCAAPQNTPTEARTCSLSANATLWRANEPIGVAALWGPTWSATSSHHRPYSGSAILTSRGPSRTGAIAERAGRYGSVGDAGRSTGLGDRGRPPPQHASNRSCRAESGKAPLLGRDPFHGHLTRPSWLTRRGGPHVAVIHQPPRPQPAASAVS